MPPTWPETQTAFAAALVDPRCTPHEFADRPDPRRGFAIHRSNSFAGLIDALRQRFPVTCRLVGDEFFRAMARDYAGSHLPRSPLLMNYGEDFPAFISMFPPAAEIPYLPDVARLEAAWSEAYHAAEAIPLQPAALAGIAPDALLEWRLTLHPSLRILRSGFPVADIWAAHQGPGPVTAPSQWRPQDVLIVRPAAEVKVSAVSAGLHAFIAALSNARGVEQAAALALVEDSEFDAGAALVTLFRIGVVVALDAPDAREIRT